jgi:hypothetical protein
LIEYALSHNTVKREDAKVLLRKASKELKQILHFYRLKNEQKATEHLVKMRPFWGKATINEFLDTEIMHTNAK